MLSISKYCPISDSVVLYPECVECREKLCKENAFYLLVAGSRTFEDYTLLKEKLDYLLKNKSSVVIVSGGARGADSLAKRYAKEKGYYYKEFPANWDKFGKRAGYLRNIEMQEYIAKQQDRGIVAFWDGKSKGTAQNFGLAKKYKNNLKIVKI